MENEYELELYRKQLHIPNTFDYISCQLKEHEPDIQVVQV